MIKEIKATSKITDSRIFINDNFKELDRRLKKLEEKLKIKKPKIKKTK